MGLSSETPGVLLGKASGRVPSAMAAKNGLLKYGQSLVINSARTLSSGLHMRIWYGNLLNLIALAYLEIPNGAAVSDMQDVKFRGNRSGRRNLYSPLLKIPLSYLFSTSSTIGISVAWKASMSSRWLSVSMKKLGYRPKTMLSGAMEIIWWAVV